MYLRAIRISFVFSSVFLLFCGQNTTAPQQHGSIEIFVFLHKPTGSPLFKAAAQSAGQEILWDNLIIEISAADIDTIRDTIDLHETNLSTTIDIPAGDDRRIAVWTENDANIFIHKRKDIVTDIVAAEETSVAFELYPAVGSIYIQIARVPTDIDSLIASFTWNDNIIRVAQKREGMMFLALDYIPDGAVGELVIRAKSSTGLIHFADTVSMTFRADVNGSYQAQFHTSPGNVNLDVSLHLPAVTVVTGAIEVQSPGEETGPLLFSEIMYSGDSDSDYVEIWNPSAESVTIDTLILEIQGTSGSTSKSLIIPDFELHPGGYFVISNCGSDFPAADTCLASMALPKSGGRMLTLKRSDGTVIDYLTYTVGALDWPRNEDKTAIIFFPDFQNIEDNNFGTNWLPALSPIVGTTHKGTPGESGK